MFARPQPALREPWEARWGPHRSQHTVQLNWFKFTFAWVWNNWRTVTEGYLSELVSMNNKKERARRGNTKEIRNRNKTQRSPLSMWQQSHESRKAPGNKDYKYSHQGHHRFQVASQLTRPRACPLATPPHHQPSLEDSAFLICVGSTYLSNSHCRQTGQDLGSSSQSDISSPMDLMSVSPKIHVMKPNPQGEEGIRRWGFGKAIRSWGWSPHEWDLSPYNEAPSRLLPRGHSEKRPSTNQEAGSHQTPNLPAPWSWTSTLQNHEK